MKNTQLANKELHDAALRLVAAKRNAILLVEDTAAHAIIIQRAFDTSIWVIEHVTRAQAALSAFSTDPDRIVLLDLSLPDSTGLDLLKRLHAINPGAPIIIVTSTDQVPVSVTAMQNGAWDYVVKSTGAATGSKEKVGESIARAVQNAWDKRMYMAEQELCEQSKVVELIKKERLDAIESIIKTVCHEVNNPLSGIVALSQILKSKESLDSDMQHLADTIHSSAKEVANVVKKLYSISNDKAPYENG